ncbi:MULTISPECIES: helix-turn-helix domain-containing protein [Clostridium]|uniref:Helix-turn-helix transcriptional regulator n=1 Tax=Clostridium sporogenes TaxID=1509 RepID=A0A7X5PAR4_CLOSG|nr:helix-turn-helix transcriptional regulator [Clostridium sporogenes]AJD31701.1 tetratricopeptide repeat family protein [Clostridium botulinum Prevot_594]KOY64793.1 ferrous iron transport protein B [Clostridium sporogenes]MBY7015491.1 helix-turn-helix transcriptional regulator [Clostridium sporogenes]MDS1008715.1 helix-turn-helix transcriptional regulator [Clostridium sporogenes]NFD95643.1 helix-turn-helix transcriptional regulator [Clostridium sporogenes]
MEILSVGQKIKRARVYKGYTLKELCGDTISVSKMSCIENDKIKPDDEILKIISEKLEIDIKYLKAGVKEQLLDNIDKLKYNKNASEYEKILEYNLKYAEEYKYYHIAFYIIHMLFNHYLENSEIEKLQLIISKYYDYWLKSSIDENKIIYYMDIAKLFFETKEYIEAASYYRSIRKIAQEKNNYILLSEATYDEAACYIRIKEFDKAYEIAVSLIDLIDFLDNNIKKAEVYKILAILSLRLDRKKFENYEEKSYVLYGNDLIHKADATFKYATAMFDIGEKDKAINYINKALDLYPKNNTRAFVSFMLDTMKILLKNNILYRAQEISDEILNYAIKINNIRFIEKAYYYKAIILEKQGSLDTAEMYMNLSLDSILKFGTKQEIYERYMKMGNMYHKMNQVGESIKYFNLAIKLSKKL